MAGLLDRPTELQTRTEPECAACEDSGWLPKHCDGTRDVICGRTRAHLPHRFVVACDCRGMNRTYNERVQSNRRLA